MANNKSYISWTPAATAEQAVAQCVMANRILSNEGLLDMLGHVSVRNPHQVNTFFQARAVSPELVTKKDIHLIDFNGKVISETAMRPYGERFIHAGIFKKRPDVNAIYHGHPEEVIVLTALGVDIRAISGGCGMLCRPLPVFTDEHGGAGTYVGEKSAGDRLSEKMGDALGIIMKGHGCTVTGNSVAQMILNAVCLRDSARMQLRALPMGDPVYISEEEGSASSAHQYSASVLERCWNYWVVRANKVIGDVELF